MIRFLPLTFVFLLASVSTQNCGRQGGNSPCPNGNCCSQYGYCGNTLAHCLPSNNCQYQCSGGGGGGGSNTVSAIITSSVFNQILKYRNNPRCKAPGFYTYNAFINAARSCNGFVPLEALKTGEESPRLSLLKPPMKQQVDGQVHQMAHMLGDIVLLENKTRPIGTVTPLTGHVPKATSVEDLYNYLSKFLLSVFTNIFFVTGLIVLVCGFY
ncbi:putative chitinase [Helianthus annuus]|uniref:Chitinase n=1 Tax=Helianthus annuus TaxID=4232 RepID=A0A251TIP3_HELAN|nr:putative chitinase [Helianthus annuus]KAJ0549681.1 putative chitinase [Helianthus annuus]KAJ0556159.1 putative chitinase [Helianthus annuus]KAJ0562636.1 putative chitinase [Helianthus annuus]KAJ0728011.1 putative chitinase [Helianthus annuus]